MVGRWQYTDADNRVLADSGIRRCGIIANAHEYTALLTGFLSFATLRETTREPRTRVNGCVAFRGCVEVPTTPQYQPSFLRPVLSAFISPRPGLSLNTTHPLSHQTYHTSPSPTSLFLTTPHPLSPHLTLSHGHLISLFLTSHHPLAPSLSTHLTPSHHTSPSHHTLHSLTTPYTLSPHLTLSHLTSLSTLSHLTSLSTLSHLTSLSTPSHHTSPHPLSPQLTPLSPHNSRSCVTPGWATT